MNTQLLARIDSQIAAARARHDAAPNDRVRSKYRTRLIKLNRQRRHVKTGVAGRWRHVWRAYELKNSRRFPYTWAF